MDTPEKQHVVAGRTDQTGLRPDAPPDERLAGGKDWPSRPSHGSWGPVARRWGQILAMGVIGSVVTQLLMTAIDPGAWVEGVIERVGGSAFFWLLTLLATAAFGLRPAARPRSRTRPLPLRWVVRVRLLWPPWWWAVPVGLAAWVLFAYLLPYPETADRSWEMLTWVLWPYGLIVLAAWLLFDVAGPRIRVGWRDRREDAAASGEGPNKHVEPNRKKSDQTRSECVSEDDQMETMKPEHCEDDATPKASDTELPTDFPALREWVFDDREITRPDQDRFGGYPIAKRIARRLKEDENASIALVGPRGSGKTSIMKMVEYELRGQPHIRLVHVSLWGFTSAEAAVRGILQELTTELGRQVGGLSVRGLSEQYVRLIGTINGRWGELLRAVQPARTMDQILDRIEEILEATGLRIVLCIEDLDRFAPETVEEGERESELSLIHI